MIERVVIGHNPVTLRERFSLELGPGTGKRQFSRVGIERRKMGGFWQASFTYIDDRISLQEFFLNGLTRDVKINNNVLGVDFEGEVIGLRLSGVGSTVRKRSLEQVANKVSVRYKDAAGTFQRSAVASDQPSQDKYGILEYVVSGGQLTASGIANNLATQILNRKKEAKAIPEQMQFGGGIGVPDLSLEVICGGYIRRFARRLYNQTASTGTQSADLEIADINAATGQFVSRTSLSANSVGITKEYDSDRDPLGIMFDIAALGDGLNPPQPWVLYMDTDRVLVYEPAAASMRIVA